MTKFGNVCLLMYECDVVLMDLRVRSFFMLGLYVSWSGWFGLEVLAVRL